MAIPDTLLLRDNNYSFTVIEYGENSRLRIQEDKSLDKIIREDGSYLTREVITNLYSRLENKARELKITLNEHNQKTNIELAGIIESTWEDGGLIT